MPSHSLGAKEEEKLTSLMSRNKILKCLLNVQYKSSTGTIIFLAVIFNGDNESYNSLRIHNHQHIIHQFFLQSNYVLINDVKYVGN